MNKTRGNNSDLKKIKMNVTEKNIRHCRNCAKNILILFIKEEFEKKM